MLPNIPAKGEPFWYAGNPTRGCTAANLSCLPASNTAEVLSRCLSAHWFPRQQEYDNVAFDMTEGIISLTNRDNRHKEGWGREEYGGVGWRWRGGLLN